MSENKRLTIIYVDGHSQVCGPTFLARPVYCLQCAALKICCTISHAIGTRLFWPSAIVLGLARKCGCSVHIHKTRCYLELCVKNVCQYSNTLDWQINNWNELTVITELSMWTRFEGLRSEHLLTTFYDFLTRHFEKKPVKSCVFWNRKNVKYVFSSGWVWPLRRIRMELFAMAHVNNTC